MAEWGSVIPRTARLLIAVLVDVTESFWIGDSCGPHAFDDCSAGLGHLRCPRGSGHQ
jgi:hypothetical protein